MPCSPRSCAMQPNLPSRAPVVLAQQGQLQEMLCPAVPVHPIASSHDRFDQAVFLHAAAIVQSVQSTSPKCLVQILTLTFLFKRGTFARRLLA